jgi:4,5-DOPA dioxygenase extradiol
VHNLRDFFSGRPATYAGAFIDLTGAALRASDPIGQIGGLMKDPSYKRAHPSDEHFLPIVVAVAAAETSAKTRGKHSKDEVDDVYISHDGLGWGMWKWAA